MLSDILTIPDLICCWDFDRVNPFVSKGRYPYTLVEGNGRNEITDDGILSGSSVMINETQYLYIPRNECPALDIHGRDAQVTVLAWVRRQRKSYSQCEAIAGMWNETRKQRQYCLFLDIQLYESADQVCGHISGVGGPTPGEKWCIDVSVGKHKVLYNEWSFVGFSYDGNEIRSYLDGRYDEREGRNPYPYPEGIFDGGITGSDFTVGAVHRGGEMGNFFVGKIAGLAVFNRALSADEIQLIHKLNPITKNDSGR
ncbi:LamG-like jellyroll fold domain-containing protein [Flavitalea antarctica]